MNGFPQNRPSFLRPSRTLIRPRLSPPKEDKEACFRVCFQPVKCEPVLFSASPERSDRNFPEWDRKNSAGGPNGAPHPPLLAHPGPGKPGAFARDPSLRKAHVFSNPGCPGQVLSQRPAPIPRETRRGGLRFRCC